MGKSKRKKIVAEYDGYIIYINIYGYPVLAQRVEYPPDNVKVPVFDDFNHLFLVVNELLAQVKKKTGVRK